MRGQLVCGLFLKRQVFFVGTFFRRKNPKARLRDCYENNGREYLYKHMLERHNVSDEERAKIMRYVEFHKKMEERLRHNRGINARLKVLKISQALFLIFNIAFIVSLFTFFDVKAITILFAMFILLISIVSITAGYRFEKTISKPVENLKEGMRKVANGDLNASVEVSLMNEIGFLTVSFNLMVAKLRESEKIKKEYEENRKLLIASISHDLKTPITAIEAYIEAILDKTITSEEKKNEYLEVIYKNSTYMNKLIDDLFLFSKLDMQKLDFNFEKVDIGAFMKDLAEEYKFELNENGYDLEYNDKLEKNHIIKMDRKRLEQSFRNILSNSMRYADNEKLKIDITLKEREGGVEIRIADNGIGILEENLEKIFDRFYREESARTKDLSNTGLGLSISKELIEAMGGRIRAENHDGAVFIITLNDDV